MIVRSLQVSPGDLERATGWAMKAEGLCKGDRCVELRRRSDQALDVREVAEALRMPLVEDREAGLWALGPESGGRALVTADAPELLLPDRRGEPFRLSSLRGRKVLLVAWASW